MVRRRRKFVFLVILIGGKMEWVIVPIIASLFWTFGELKCLEGQKVGAIEAAGLIMSLFERRNLLHIDNDGTIRRIKDNGEPGDEIITKAEIESAQNMVDICAHNGV